MSSHVLDMSGQRQLQLTLNDPAVTRAYASAKPGDDTSFSFGGREIRIPLGAGVRVQRRLAPIRKMVRDENGPVKENGEYVYEDGTEERLVLVFTGSLSGFIRSSANPDERQSEKPPFEQHTHTTVTVKRRGDDEWDWTEAGELLEEHDVAELIAPDRTYG